MLRKFAPLAAALILTGCAGTSNIPVDYTSLEASKPTTIAVTKREKPGFAAMTAGKAAFAMIGAIAMVTEGNAIIKENEVEDPAGYIGENIANILANRLRLAPVRFENQIADSISSATLSEQYSETDLLVDVQTTNWSFAYFPTDWNNYRVIYHAKLRVVDTRSQTTVAEGFCSNVPEQDETSPTHEELLKNKAARLKSELRAAADKCINQFTTEILKI